MTLPASGSISLSQVAVELGRASNANTSLGESAVRTLAGIASGTISLSNLWGKSAIIKKGYFVGGRDTSTSSAVSYSEVDGIDFTTEAAINPSAGISTTAFYLAGINTDTNGYCQVGQQISGGTTININSFHGFVFSSETATNNSAALKAHRRNTNEMNYTTKGYICGGITEATTASAEIEAFNYASETVTDTATALSAQVFAGAGYSSSTRGYAGDVSDLVGMIFSTETAINPSAQIPGIRQYGASFNSSSTGYYSGGFYIAGYAPVYVNDIGGIIFSSETAVDPSATLATARANHCGVNSSSTGYFAGGNSPLKHSEIDGIIFSSNAATNPSASLSVARYSLCGFQPYSNNP